VQLRADFSGGTALVDQGVGGITSGSYVSTAPLADTTTFTLTVTGPDEQSVSQTLEIQVVPAPRILELQADATTILEGTSAELTATFADGEAQWLPDLGAVQSGVPLSTGPLQTTTEYLLTVTNAAGASIEQPLQIVVVPPPEVLSFESAASPIPSGASTELTAVFSAGTGVIEGAIGPVESGVAVSTGPLLANQRYTLTVSGFAGSVASASTVVAVLGNCGDALWTDDETDVDCGGSCGPCADGLRCVESEDCSSGSCEQGVCQPLLVSEWKLDEASGDVALDSAGGNPAQLNGAHWVQGIDCIHGSCLYLDGGDFLQVAAPLGLPLGNEVRSVELWAKPEVDLVSRTESSLFQYGNTANSQMFGLITSANNPGHPYFFGYNADLSGGPLLLAGRWYHLAVTYDGTTLRMYVDGALVSSAAIALSTQLSPDGLTLGLRPPGTTWTGFLDEVRLYRSVLSPGLIAAHADVMQVPRCNNGIQDLDETLVDCGPNCPCDLGRSCGVAADCASGDCVDGLCTLPVDCKSALALEPARVSGRYFLDPDGSGPGMPFGAYCDMTTHGGGFTLCYSESDAIVHVSSEVWSPVSAGTPGYRSDCRNIPFTEVLYRNEDTGEAAWFTRNQPGTLTLAGLGYDSAGITAGTFTGGGVADTSYDYQLNVCDSSWMWVGLMMSGKTSCSKACSNWCGDLLSDYYRTDGDDDRYASTQTYDGTAFRENGARSVSVKTLTVGLR